MAKKPDLSGMFKATEQRTGDVKVDLSDLNKGVIKATGVGLREGELAALKAIAEQLGGDEPIARNALIRWAVRHFITEFRRGAIDLKVWIEEPPPPKKTLRYPGDED